MVWDGYVLCWADCHSRYTLHAKTSDHPTNVRFGKHQNRALPSSKLISSKYPPGFDSRAFQPKQCGLPLCHQLPPKFIVIPGINLFRFRLQWQPSMLNRLWRRHGTCPNSSNGFSPTICHGFYHRVWRQSFVVSLYIKLDSKYQTVCWNIFHWWNSHLVRKFSS